jgi:hypothetical protein
VTLSWRWRKCTGVVVEGPDNHHEGMEEGVGGRGEGDAQHDKQHIEGAVALGGGVAVHRAVLLGSEGPCNRQRTRGMQHLGGRCGGSGSVVWGEAAVQDTVEAVGRKGGATDHAVVVGHSV